MASNKFCDSAIEHISASDRKLTIAIVYREKTDDYGVGYSVLSTKENNFSKKVGRVNAVGRAFSTEAITLPKNVVIKYDGTIRTIRAIAKTIENTLFPIVQDFSAPYSGLTLKIKCITRSFIKIKEIIHMSINNIINIME